MAWWKYNQVNWEVILRFSACWEKPCCIVVMWSMNEHCCFVLLECTYKIPVEKCSISYSRIRHTNNIYSSPKIPYFCFFSEVTILNETVVWNFILDKTVSLYFKENMKNFNTWPQSGWSWKISSLDKFKQCGWFHFNL